MATVGERAPGALRTASTFLVLAVAYAAAAHGAYYQRELRVVVMLLAVAVAAALLAVAPSRADVNAATVPAAALALWYVVAGAVAGHVGGAVPAVELLASLIAVVVVVRRLDDAERDLVIAALLVIGALVALTGWVGVAWHQTPRGLNSEGLWRASTTITYPNVAGSLLGALSLVALARLDRDGASRARWHALAAFALLTGTLATASRGAIVGLGAGLVVLACLRRARLVGAVPPVAGALVATVALLPSMPAAHHAHPAAALVGLLAGAALSVVPVRVAVAIALGALVVFVVVPGPRHAATGWWQPVRDGRFTATSHDRSHELHAALHVASRHPVVGVGPGEVNLEWTIVYLVPLRFHARYVHNEYVQELVEAGAVASVLTLAGFAAVAITLLQRRHAVDAALFAGTAAALVALAVQSATDFLWHVPIVPLVATVVVALCLAPGTDRAVRVSKELLGEYRAMQ